jgi:chromosome segregation ATPase
MRIPAFVNVAVACVLGAFAGHANAQSARAGGSGNAQLVQQMQQLASERTALQAENARMKKELADMTRERDQLRSGRTALDQRGKASEAAAARSAKEKESLEAENQKLKDRMQDLVAKFRETAETLRGVETERTTFKQSLTSKEGELAACVKRNAALFELNEEVLTRVADEGMFSRLASLEPFTKIKRVELENLVDDYKFRAQDQQVSPPTPTNTQSPRPLIAQ